MERVYFVSSSKNKFEEIKAVLGAGEAMDLKLDVKWENINIPELQTGDSEKLVRAKALSAFAELRRPVLVEHTALNIHAFNGLPGLQTNLFYSRIGYQGIVEYCRFKNDFKADAESILCFCDGKKYYIGHGKESGWIKERIDAVRDGFAWDSIFYPEADNTDRKTYQEMGNQKNNRSMRKKAWDALRPQLQPRLFSTGMREEAPLHELAQLIKERKVLLFLGAGIPASIGRFPSWRNLIGDLGEKAGFERELFETYGDNMMLAESLDHDLVYKHLRENLSIESREDLKKELDKSRIYQLLLDLDFPVIYTTNYDHLIESYYEMKSHKFSKVTNIADMGNTDPASTRIMKFHGDIDDKKSIVLSESHYFNRMDFQSFMDIQLQADLLKYHVLYLGYSLSDINVKRILYLSRKRWEQGQTSKVSYIFTATPNLVQKGVFQCNDIITFSGEGTDKKEETRVFLETLLEKVREKEE